MKDKIYKRCRHCKFHSVTGYFLWERTNPFMQSFTTVKEIKNSILVSCPVCKNEWLMSFEDHEKKFVKLDFINSEMRNILRRWEEKDFFPSDSQLKVIKSIQATPWDAYGNGRGTVRVPCKCITNTDETIDFSLIIFSWLSPPEHGTNIRFVDEIKEILPSEYALPPAVRYLTTLAEESHPYYAPSWAIAPDGKYVEFSWTNYFYKSEKYAGSVLKPVDQKETLQKKDAGELEICELTDLAPQETIFYSDWKDLCFEFTTNGDHYRL